MSTINHIISDSDFRKNPAVAIWKRLFWHARWKFTKTPLKLTSRNGLRFELPKSGPAAAIYYSAVSEPDTALFLSHFLEPGMTFVDVGAHLGEFTLLGSCAVGEKGRVHSFEANPSLFSIIKRNIEINGQKNVIVNPLAVSDKIGKVQFLVCDEPAMSSLAIKHRNRKVGETLIDVLTTTLDTYFSELSMHVNLVKMDVEGAELLVFKGAKKLLELPPQMAPVWFFEYSAQNYSNFGYTGKDIVTFLREFGYSLWWLKDNEVTLNAFDIDSHPLNLCNLVAEKTNARIAWLRGKRNYLSSVTSAK